jgi:hypothetical protein
MWLGAGEFVVARFGAQYNMASRLRTTGSLAHRQSLAIGIWTNVQYDDNLRATENATRNAEYQRSIP